MQKMIIISDCKEEIDGYEFVAFGLATEHDGEMMSIYTVVICKDENGYLEEVPISKVRFI